jgi:hypothetical protein
MKVNQSHLLEAWSSANARNVVLIKQAYTRKIIQCPVKTYNIIQSKMLLGTMNFQLLLPNVKLNVQFFMSQFCCIYFEESDQHKRFIF